MAVDAIAIGWHMVVVFAGGGNAIVTGPAVVRDALMVKCGLGKCCGGMAHRTILGDRNVGWIDLGVGSGRNDAIVARRTVVDDPAMIEYSRCKRSAGYMADSAILGCYDVVDLGVLAGRIGAVVAGIAAHSQHGGVAVVDKRVGKIGRVMAQGTVGRGCRVRRSRRLSPGSKGDISGAAVVAGDTVTGNAFVSQHRGWGEGVDIMANVTILGSRQMICILD